MEHIIVKWS